jgi:ArsR family transcriptional regulator, arsenate/arsenite/antimonite-responsive transcriptional repressor
MAVPVRKPKVSAICAPDEESGMPAATGGPEADAELAVFAKALAHPTRVRILRLLAKKEARMCSHIVDELPLAQSTVSEHLRILRAAGLVRANESGACVGYCVIPAKVRRLKQLLDAL